MTLSLIDVRVVRKIILMQDIETRRIR